MSVVIVAPRAHSGPGFDAVIAFAACPATGRRGLQKRRENTRILEARNANFSAVLRFCVKTKTTMKFLLPSLWAPKHCPAGLGPELPAMAPVAAAVSAGGPKGLCKNQFRFCWRGFWLAGEARRGSIPAAVCERGAIPRARDHRAKAPQPFGAGRHRAICVVPRSVEYLRGYTPCLEPCIWPGGAPAKIGSNFARTLSRCRRGSFGVISPRRGPIGWLRCRRPPRGRLPRW
ncbi:MAG: hypothetical protein BWX48_02919 [Verrucomicrobia bacterium ADurb.Bin006]|nr:MAG: hypothetical protein BWX48_02919 [Verrucomicrobia bacterium ADurb.Bin006]